MIMIQEQYVSFETAKLLKDKGFDEECWCYYHNSRLEHYFRKISNRGWTTTGNVAASTQQMAMKWLREVHKISIEITSTGYLIDNDVEWECDIKAGHRLYFKHITNEKSFESCAEAAIKYCLENLI